MHSESDQYLLVEKANGSKEGEEKTATSFSMRFTQQPILWFNLVATVFFHVVSLYGFLFCIPRFKLATLVWGMFIVLCSGFGVTAGVHRLWSHRSYKAKLPLKIILLICYSMAGMYSVYRFVRDHRTHHKFSDTDADPHNSKRGFWFSHVGWLVQKKHPDVISKQATIDMSDITNDPWLNFHGRYFLYFKVLFCFVLPTIPPIWLWNEHWFYSVIAMVFMRYTYVLNGTFSVNSFAHLWGQRPYNKRIMPVENVAVAIYAFGEGWHINYHHVFPWDYRASEYGVGKYNLTTTLLDLFQKIGWVYDVKIPSAGLIENTKRKYGDGCDIREVSSEYADHK